MQPLCALVYHRRVTVPPHWVAVRIKCEGLRALPGTDGLCPGHDGLSSDVRVEKIGQKQIPLGFRESKDREETDWEQFRKG